MKLENIATIRTGVVATRKKSNNGNSAQYNYKLLNLKCATPEGLLDLDCIEDFATDEPLKDDYITKKGDILVRLSTPYTSILIDKDEWCGLLVPSHFAIIRVDSNIAVPEYVLWILKQESTFRNIYAHMSGASFFSTINSRFFNLLMIPELPKEKQIAIGQLQVLSDRQQALLCNLANQKTLLNRLMLNRIFNNIKKEKSNDY